MALLERIYSEGDLIICEKYGKCIVFLSALQYMKELTVHKSYMYVTNVRNCSSLPLTVKYIKGLNWRESYIDNMRRHCKIPVTSENMWKLMVRVSVNPECEKSSFLHYLLYKCGIAYQNNPAPWIFCENTPIVTFVICITNNILRNH